MKTTSLEAFEAIKPKRKTWHNRIASVMSYKKDMTYREIAKKLGVKEASAISKRMSEMFRLGKVKINSIRKCTIGNSNCSAYILN